MARKSAEERREEILAIALRHFADGGYHGTSTEAIAREAGISQPYLFRLFRTKKRAVPRLRRPLLRAGRATSFRARPPGGARGRAAGGDGPRVRRASCCPTATRC